MNATEQFLDFQYKKIDVIDEARGIYLVQDQLSMQVYVKRSLPVSMMQPLMELKRIRHKNLMRVIEVYAAGDKCIVIEEYVNGPSLDELLRQNGTMEPETATARIRELCSALRVLHRHGLVHRDVNPCNIRITENGILKLMDIDTVRRYEGKKRDTMLLGTVGYAAPEQFGLDESDARTDIYAVGVVLNLMLTGRFPADGMYGGDRHLQTVIWRCTRLDKNERYADVDELECELERTGSGYLFQKIYRGLPGLRTDKTIWKMVTAVVYFLWFSMMCVILKDGKLPTSGASLRRPEAAGVMFVLYILPYAVLGDLGNCIQRVVGAQPNARTLAIIIRIVLFAMITTAGTVLEAILC